MIQICKDRAVIVNFHERDNNDLFIVSMIPGHSFLKGLLKAELRAKTGEITRFYWAEIEFVDDEDENATLEIISLKMEEPAETSPPAF